MVPPSNKGYQYDFILERNLGLTDGVKNWVIHAENSSQEGQHHTYWLTPVCLFQQTYYNQILRRPVDNTSNMTTSNEIIGYLRWWRPRLK